MWEFATLLTLLRSVTPHSTLWERALSGIAALRLLTRERAFASRCSDDRVGYANGTIGQSCNRCTNQRRNNGRALVFSRNRTGRLAAISDKFILLSMPLELGGNANVQADAVSVWLVA
jgi:hypothetical protein